MNTMLTCAACDRTAWDVHSRIVDFREPALTRVTLDDGEVVEVPELYGTEPQCVDTVACRERVEEVA